LQRLGLVVVFKLVIKKIVMINRTLIFVFFVLPFVISNVNAKKKEKEIVAEIIFENLTDNEFKNF